MAKPVGALCNLDCSYCYYRGNLGMQQQAPLFMREDVLEEFVKQYIHSQASPVIVFNWQGGEPLLAGTEFFRKAVSFQRKHQGRKKIENTMQTNGTLLDDVWCRFLKDNRFLVGVSIDGPREIHDHYRKGPGMSGSWDMTMKGISMLREYDIPFNTLSCITAHSADYPLEIYHFLKSIGSEYLQFSPVAERQSASLPGEQAMLSPQSVPSLKYGEFLCRIFDEWVMQDIGKVFIRIFEASLASWLGEDPGSCLYSRTCGNALAIEKNGDVYACDHFVSPGHFLGNIMKEPLLELVLSGKQEDFGGQKQHTLPGECRTCEYLFACNGECPKNRFALSENGEKGVNYFCSGLKHYFSHVAPYMDFMANEVKNGRSVRNVQQAVTENTFLGSN